MKLTSEAVHGMTAPFLLPKFADPKPIPDFHHELWRLACDDHPRVAIAAPRGHAKSTAITLSFVLATVLFRMRRFVVILSGTERQAMMFLSDIKSELLENKDLQEFFGVKPRFPKESESDLIVELESGEQFRIISKGSGPSTRIRGLKWKNKRPDMIICDDIEDDESVLNEERRFKFRQWFFNAVLPCGSDDCVVRIVGTILHKDSLLERLMPKESSKFYVDDGLMVREEGVVYNDASSENYRAWKSVKFRAHNEDFSQILWPEKFTRERLLSERKEYIDQGFPEGYAQEYLNTPVDGAMAYFRNEDLLPIPEDEADLRGDYYAAADLAISLKDKRAYSVIVVAKLLENRRIHVVDVRRFRGDSVDICNEIFEVQSRYDPVLFAIEQENISRSIGPFLYEQMGRDGNPYINFNLMPTGNQDKIKRARSIQGKTRLGMVSFDQEASWWPDFYEELLSFPSGTYRDQVDAFAWIGIMLDKMVDVYSTEQIEDREEEDYENEYFDSIYEDGGVNWLTNY